MIRVLLVEDDLDIAAGIGEFLQAHEVSVEFAYNAAQARERIRGAHFDLLVLDVNLPDQDGISLCRELKSQWQLGQPVIFLTARGGLEDKLAGFSAGGVDYIVKPFAPAELDARIKALTSHIPATGSGSLAVGHWSLHRGSGRLICSGKGMQLSATGALLIESLMRAHPECVSRENLCSAVWGDAIPESDPLRAHIYELRKALELCFGSAPIATVRGIGYRFGESI